MNIHHFVAIDLGATSGRVILASLSNGTIEMEEIHRFPDTIIQMQGHFYWDLPAIYKSVIEGLKKVAERKVEIASIGIDTWGVDFGLLRKDGTLIENPVHYRDKRNSGMIEKAEEYISKERMYDITGIQFMDFNTVFQLLSLKENRPYILDEAETMLFTPDLLNYMLTGVKSTEYSIATTSQMVDPVNVDTKVSMIALPSFEEADKIVIVDTTA